MGFFNQVARQVGDLYGRLTFSQKIELGGKRGEVHEDERHLTKDLSARVFFCGRAPLSEP